MNTPNILPLALGLILFAFFISSIFTVPFINLLYKIKMTRRVEGGKKKLLFDKLHDKKAGTPIGGGILMIFLITALFGFVFPLVEYMGVFVESSYNLRNELIVIFFTFISFGLLGLLDDYIKIFGRPAKKTVFGVVAGLSKMQKFGLQFILAFISGSMLYYLLGIHILHIPLLDIVLDLGIFYIPFSAFVIIFFTNAFNFTDGLDGLASGLLLIYLMAYVFIAVNALDTPLFIFIGIWLGNLLAFLYFNVWPARIWLGDAGALSFGAMIAIIGLLLGNVAVLFIIGAPFVIEATSSLIQILGWKYLKRPIFPLAPIHHAFLAIGWEEPKIVMRAWLMGLVFAVFGLWLATI